MANSDQSVILCRRKPEECTSAELMEVAHYIPGYMSKGNKGSGEYAAIWKHMIKDASPDSSVKKLVRSLLIKICGNDYPRQQAHAHTPANQPRSLPAHAIVTLTLLRPCARCCTCSLATRATVCCARPTASSSACP